MERERDNRRPNPGLEPCFSVCLGCRDRMTRAKNMMQPLRMCGRVFSGNPVNEQAQGGSRYSVERFGVMLSRGARWNQLWRDLGRFIAVQALPSPECDPTTWPVLPCRACSLRALSGVWGSEIGGMWGGQVPTGAMENSGFHFHRFQAVLVPTERNCLGLSNMSFVSNSPSKLNGFLVYESKYLLDA